jgi:hypothetical protein
VSTDDVTVAERWFLRHGLPWFVDAEQERVARRLAPSRLARVLGLCALPAVAVGIATAWLKGSPSFGLAVAATITGILALLYAATALQLAEIGAWAGKRTLRQLGLLVPLATRALPLLLIFTVFFFINTEVWQVASSMPAGVLWLAVLLFAALAALFLIARLPEEVDRVVEEVDDDGVIAATRHTPLAESAARLARGPSAGNPLLDVPLTRLERANLVLVLLVVQAGQVLLLAISVFAFFMLFGSVAIRPEIVESWLGHGPTSIGWEGSPLSVQLLQVSVFLAAFSGLYFTVYAVTDPTYREQFFTQITNELTRAVGVRAVYTALRAPPASLDP